MKTKTNWITALLVLPLLAVAADGAAGQDAPRAQQDTAREAAARRHGPRMQRAAMMRGPWRRHGMEAGPGLLLRFKDELRLSDDQVGRLEEIMEQHREAAREQADKLRELRSSFSEARAANDWDAVERVIDEQAALRAGLAKMHLSAVRESQAILNDEQRATFETWQEGHRLFQRQRMERWRRPLREGREERGRLHRPPPPEGEPPGS